MKTVVESVYPEVKSDPPTTFKPYPTLIVTGSGLHEQIEELPQVDKSTKAPPPWEKNLKQLTDLLLAVSGDNLEEFRDERFDSETSRTVETNIDPTPLPPVTYFPLMQSAASKELGQPAASLEVEQLAANLEVKESRDRRMILGGILAQGVPVLTQFAGSLIKMVLNQVIHRPGSQTYKDGLIGKFVPRALS